MSIGLVFSNEGLFEKANSATIKYSEEKAREELTLILSNAQVKKYGSELTQEEQDAELDAEIAKVGALLPKTDPASNIQQVIIGEYIFEIDRSVPKITERGCIGKANEVIITSQTTYTGWPTPTATVTGTITKYGGGTIVNVEATATNGVIITGLPTTGGNYTIPNITTDTVITITTTDSEGKTKTHTISINLEKDATPPIITEATAIANELNIKISAKVADRESGVASFKYKIKPATGLSKAEGDLPQDGTEVTIISTAEETYTIIITAINNAGKTETKTITGVKTVDGGVIKHIKLSDGTLKAVNTRDIYGATVERYTCPRDSVTDTNVNKPKWQIFYIDEADNNRVYLISKDYMAPPTTGTEMTKGIYSHTYYWNDTVLNKYKTNLPAITETTSLGKFMNNYLRDYAGTSASGQSNLQATNYMLDQTMWAEYNGAKADLAFGGPTLPLFKASYNDVCRTATKLDIQKSGTGYQVKKGTGWFHTGEGGFGDTNMQKGIYFEGRNGDPASAMWFASPSSGGVRTVMYAGCDGSVNMESYFTTFYGFRPIVSLNPNVKFKSNSDGTVYTIVN